MLQSVMQLLFAGLANGCIYALIGVSFILTYNAVGIVNFAQNGFVTLGAYLSVMAINDLGQNLMISVLTLSVIMAAIGILFERIIYRPLQNRNWVFIMISTIGVGMILPEACRIIWGAQPLTMVPLFQSYVVEVAGLKINPQYLLIMAVTVILLLALWLVFERTTVGKKLTATAEDRRMASMMGINTKRMIIVTFAISMVLSGISGFLLTPLNYCSTTMAVTPTMKAFAATIIGGFGSIPGAICGSLIIGIVETAGANLINNGMKDSFAFILLIIVLVFKPRGLFGEKSSVRV